MDYHMQRAQIYQIMALNNEMLKNGQISRDEHEFVRYLQVKKLTNLHGRGTMGEKIQELT